MAKIFKNITIGLLGVLAFVLAGFFFAGCKKDFSKIQLVADKSTVELEVGESAEVVFEFENFKSGFSNAVMPNAYADGQTDIFSVSEVEYLSKSRFKLSITALAGGHGTLNVCTLEGGKECNVDVSVKQYSKSLNVNRPLLYVSNKTSFEPNADMFTFDSNTTEKELSFYYIVPEASDGSFENCKVESFDEGLLSVTLNAGEKSFERDVKKFDLATLDEKNQLHLSLLGADEKIGNIKAFNLLSVYNHSLANAAYDELLCKISTVHILPDLQVNITGGYLIDGSVAEFGQVPDEVKIVPNNAAMREYLLRIETINVKPDDHVEVSIEKSNQYVVADYFDYDGEAGNFSYIKVSQSSLRNASTNLGLSIFYNLAQQVEDESVKLQREIVFNTEIAPTEILVNGKAEPDPMKLYYVRTSPLFGWNDVFVDVISGLESTPVFSEVYLTFESTFIDVTYDNATVKSGVSNPNYDLSKPFRVRAVGTQEVNTQIEVHVVSDIVPEGELVAIIDCEILEGARRLRLEDRFLNENQTYKTLFVDLNAGQVDFSKHLYANDEFDEVNFQRISGVDVVDFSVFKNEGKIFTFDPISGRFHLNLKVSPKAVGTGRYEVILGNGTSTELTFTSLRSLKAETTYVQLLADENSGVTYSSLSRLPDAGFDNVLNLEILNPSKKGEISFGSLATFQINSNATSIETSLDTRSFLDINQGANSVFSIFTKDSNGNTKITFNLTGMVVDDFVTRSNPLTVVVNVSSYSLVDEFYLKNGDNYALSNTIYYGHSNVTGVSNTLTFTPNVRSEQSNNFYQYQFVPESLKTIFAGSRKTQNGYVYDVGLENFSSLISQQLVLKTFDKKFIYFKALDSSERTLDRTVTELEITKSYRDEDGLAQNEIKKVSLRISDGLMFYAENDGEFKYQEKNDFGEVVATYNVKFSNQFTIGGYGEFDMNTFTFRYTLESENPPEIVIRAMLSQRGLRGWTKSYDAHIYPTRYISVESISLLSSTRKVNFSSESLTAQIGLTLYPTNATNKDIRVEYVSTNGNPYDILTWTIDDSLKNTGVYSITLSCERFFYDPDGTIRRGKDIVDIEDFLTGTLFIYPAEWGTTHTSIINHQPIQLDVQFRNGSKTNPYVLETADDVLKINANETKLRSHYEVSTVVDMKTVTGKALPIGILQEAGFLRLVGFSGTIVGTTSSAEIANLSIDSSKFSADVGGVKYAGLFAKINASAKIENLTVSGNINLSTAGKTYASIISSINFGTLVNVGAKVTASSIVGALDSDIHFGSVTALNYNTILQDYTKYEGTGYNFKRFNLSDAIADGEGNLFVSYMGERLRVDSFGYAIDEYGEKIKFDEDGRRLSPNADFTGQTPKNMAYFDGEQSVLTITASRGNVFAGGVVGINNGRIERIMPSIDYKLYGYSGYSAYVRISVVGSGTSNKNVCLGGIAGVSSYHYVGNFVPDEGGVNGGDIVLRKLLVGGELDTLGAKGFSDNVGGIAGYVSGRSSEKLIVGVFDNTSRVFVRGNGKVGGLVGSDYFSTKTSDSSDVDFGNGNIVEAVDDGRSSVLSASIIRAGEIVLPAQKEAEDNQQTIEEKEKRERLFFAIGDGLTNGKDYGTTSDRFDFEVVSYLKRNSLTPSSTPLFPQTGSSADYYGDMLWVFVEDDGSFVIRDCRFFKFKKVDLNLEENSPFAMTTADGSANQDVFFMYYFHVSTDVANLKGTSAQDDIVDLNFVTPNTKGFYPFAMASQDVSINASSSNILSVDSNGNMTVEGTGLTAISLFSVLNVTEFRKIYIYVVNYFDKDVKSSIFYTTPSSQSANIGNDLTLYGDSFSSVYVVPTYQLNSTSNFNGDKFSISKDGILNFRNVDYRLVRNSQMTIDCSTEDADLFSSAEVRHQTLSFHKTEVPQEGNVDQYTLVPVLKIEVENEIYYFRLNKSQAVLNVSYKESASQITTQKTQQAIRTNEYFEDSVKIVSTNEQELLFYTIESKNTQLEYVQDRVPSQVDVYNRYINNQLKTYATYEEYINDVTEEDLFSLIFTRKGNVFDYVCKINTQSTAYKNRQETGRGIFGDYVITFFSSELRGGVHCTLKLRLDEAVLNYVSINNYSNINNVSSTDLIAVPTQYGLLEINLDPLDAVFERFSISNGLANSLAGASEARFSFAYQKQSEKGGVEYVIDEYFGEIVGGAFTFTYEQLLKRFEEYASKLSEGELVQFGGKIYIAYFLSSFGVEDNVGIDFDVEVTHGNNGAEKLESTISLRTKLSNFARLEFTNKDRMGEFYYLAKGLSYELALSSYGFSEEQISFSITENGKEGERQQGLIVSEYLTLSKNNGRYTLSVTDGSIAATDNIGCKVILNTYARKLVDNIEVETKDTLEIYLMEFVLNYQYTENENADIVSGMRDGVISCAIGNPWKLQLSIWDFLEYDANISTVNFAVTEFVESMTQKVEWKVYEKDKIETLENGKVIAGSDYYRISSFTVTPLRVYNFESNLYHFSVNGHYTIKNGGYQFESATNPQAKRLYTEFCFDVHEQSTQDSPEPIWDYEDLLEMKEGGWYILLNDITLPSIEYVTQNGGEQFMPIETRIAGFDGNNKKINFAGTYDFEGLSNVGMFASVKDDTILRNVKIVLQSDVNFRMSVETFNAALLAGDNAGVITNCSVEPKQPSTSLSVGSSIAATSSYVAGLVANNSGIITNSRSGVNIFSNVNLAGFVGQNAGHIASSYFRGGYLNNKTNGTTEYTAGFVVRNSGKIYTSYVSGDELGNQNSMYYTGTEDVIEASGNISGFVYNNDGEIYDSYSNIHLQFSGFYASGFVFANAGRIERCLSTSVLESYQTRNYGFVRSNNVSVATGDLQNGIFDCYYLSGDVNVYNADGSIDPTPHSVNVKLGEVLPDDYTDVQPLDGEGFKDIEKHFANFVIGSEPRDINGVWFFNENPNTRPDNFRHAYFNTGRVELVAANILANTAQRKFDQTIEYVDPETGVKYVKHYYVYTEDSEPLGASVYNPVLIASAQDFETYFANETDASNNNFSYFRLIDNIDYSSYLQNSKLYKTRFMGYLEGNFLTVSGMNLVSSENITYAGLFAEIGSSSISGAVGTVMNFTFMPKSVDFANASVVGAIGGRVDGGHVFNIKLEGDDKMVSGQNIVGGIIGLAVGRFEVQNVHSQFGAAARKIVVSENSNSFNSDSGTYEQYSFAGSVIGVASGNGKIYGIETNRKLVVLAGKAGLQFGLLDTAVKATKLAINLKEGMIVNGYSYAGLLVGESKAQISEVQILGEGEFTNFRMYPAVPYAIGGVVGLLGGGVIDDITYAQSILTSTESSSKGVEYLGGIAGKIAGKTTISNVRMRDVSFTGFKYVGGIVGSIEGNELNTFQNIQLEKVTLRAVGVGQTELGVGGLAGRVEGTSSVLLCTDTLLEANEIDKRISSIKQQLSEIEEWLKTHVGETGAEMTAKQEEKRQLESSLALEEAELAKQKTNLFDVSLNSLIYSYESKGVDINVGTIIADDNSLADHSINDTVCILSGSNNLFDLGGNFVTDGGNLVIVTDESGKVVLQETAENLFNCKITPVTRTTFEIASGGSFGFVTSKNAEMFMKQLNVALYGSPKAAVSA